MSNPKKSLKNLFAKGQRWLPLAILSSLILSAHSYAESSVWKVSKDQRSIFIAGTVHLLADEDYPLPVSFQNAYQKAEEVVFETSMDAITDPEFQLQASRAMMLPQGQTLQSTLKPQTYAALSEYLASKQVPIDRLAPFSPAGVSMTITVLEYQLMGMKPELGVDQKFYRQALSDGKTISHLESPQEQLDVLMNMGKGQEDALINYTLKELEGLSDNIVKLKSYWRVGDLKSLEGMGLKEMREQFNDTYQAMIVKRNQNWLPKIVAMFNDADTEIIFVGALHLAGKEGVLDALKAKGFKIEQL